VRPNNPILADLRPVFRGELFADAATRAVYATDASAFAVTPALVACPRDDDDVRTIVRYASEHNLSIQPRGAGTGLAGESLGPGITLDLSVHYRGLPLIDGDTVRVLPGVTANEVNLALARIGRRLAPRPAHSATRTIGGMIGTDASGSNAAAVGTMRDSVLGLTVVWDSGDRDELSVANNPRTHQIATGLADLLRERQTVIAANRSANPRDRCGYRLHDLLTPTGIDLKRILVGSEGTLAIVTEAILKSTPIPVISASAAIGFASIDVAAKAGAALGTVPGVVSCDFLDRRLASLGQGLPVSSDVESMLIIDIEADSDERYQRTVQSLLRAAAGGTMIVEPTMDAGAAAAIRQFLPSSLAALHSLRAGPRPTAIVDNLGVPPDRVPEFLSGLQALIRSRDFTASVFVNCPMGAVHLMPFVDLDHPADRDRLWPLADELSRFVKEFQGTISVRHGVGIARTPWVRSQAGEMADTYREVKRIFDPRSLFNPGKIVGPDPTRPAWPLKPVAVSQAKPLLIWDDSPLAEAGQCNGCGDCRPRSGVERMCPVFTAQPVESSTPRAKANLVRWMADPESTDERDAIRDVAKRCTNCQMCRVECRSRVDIPKLMLETKAALWRDDGTTRAGWLMARIETLIGLASRFTLTSNTLLGTRPGRWLFEKILGLDRSLRLPALRYRTFTWRAWTRGWTKRPKSPGPSRLVLFVDPLTNACDPLTGESAYAVLKHHGSDVVVLPTARPSGLAAFTAGDIETARETARKNVRILAEFVRDGYRVVCLDPSTALMISREYPNLLAEADASAVAENTVELLALLKQWHSEGTLKSDFREQDLSIGHHVPCHSKALHGRSPSVELLRLVPGFRLTAIDAGCSGMMGPWGLIAGHRADSRIIGRRMAEHLADHAIAYGASECGSCRVQMQESTGKRAVHPIQYLAMAYGLVPDVGRRLATPLTERLSR
jgi:FAD/FMN-containing dehydrogenase/Fe-S oxidoreductase